MNVFKKIILYYKYKKKKFKFLGKNVNFKQFNSKYVNSQNISIGNYSKVLDYAYIDGKGEVTIGICVIIAPHCTILTVNHNYNESLIDYLPFDNVNIMKKVIIEDYCWIGRNVMILPGVTIGRASIVAAGSVVTKSIPAYSIVGGNPIQLIKKRNIQETNRLIKNNRCWKDKKVNFNNKKIYKRSIHEKK